MRMHQRTLRTAPRPWKSEYIFSFLLLFSLTTLHLTDGATRKEGEAVLVDWAQSYDFLAEREATIDTIEYKAPIIRSYLEKNYRFTRTKLSNFLALIMSRRAVAFEMLFYIERVEFVPDRFAVRRDGQTAKSLCEIGVAVPNAFAQIC